MRGSSLEFGRCLYRGWVVHRRLRESGIVGFIQYRLRLVGTAAAGGGDAEALSEFIDVIDAVHCSTANLLVGDGVADADVHVVTGFPDMTIQF